MFQQQKHSVHRFTPAVNIIKNHIKKEQVRVDINVNDPMVAIIGG